MSNSKAAFVDVEFIRFLITGAQKVLVPFEGHKNFYSYLLHELYLIHKDTDACLTCTNKMECDVAQMMSDYLEGQEK